MNSRMTPEEAAQSVADNVNSDIARAIQDTPRLRAKYDELIAIQKKIDEARAAGRNVPIAWIQNPFHRRWYAKQDWLEDAEEK